MNIGKDIIKSATGLSEEEIEKIINNGYREIYIIGHSMGGVIASYLASKYKEVTKLVLAAPAFHYLAFNGDKVDVAKSIKKLPKLFKNYKPEEVLSRFFKIPIPTIREFMLLVEEHTGDVKNITKSKFPVLEAAIKGVSRVLFSCLLFPVSISFILAPYSISILVKIML